MRIILIILFSSMLMGCQLIKIASTPKIQPGGDPRDEVVLDLVNSESMLLNGLDESIQKQCPVRSVQKSAAIIWFPIAGKFAVDSFVDASARYLKRIKSMASKSYSANLIVSANKFEAAECIAVVRGDSKAPGMVAILKINRPDHKSYTISPIYASVRNSLALTECQKNCYLESRDELGEIGLSFALVPSSVVPVDGFYELRQFGVATVTVPAIEIGGTWQPSRARHSELLAFPGGDVVQLVIGVTETGKLPGDFDLAEAQVKAVAAALSPGIVEEIKNRYKD